MQSRSKILVIVNDAGPAEIIAAYIRDNADRKDFSVYVAGPAERIFKREHILFQHILSSPSDIEDIVKKHKDSALFITGTGWMTNIESISLDRAKHNGLRTAVYLDSWTNYRERFGFPNNGWERTLPDELWVGDDEALVLAKSLFQSLPVKILFVGNGYFVASKKIFKNKKIKKTKQEKDEILFLSNMDSTSYKVCSDLFAVLAVIKNAPILRIRLHPADDNKQYESLVNEYKDRVKVEYSSEENLACDLARVRAVIGTETVAMAVAVLCGVCTIRVIQPGVAHEIPHRQIINVSNRQELRACLCTKFNLE